MNFFGHAWIAQRNEATRGGARAQFVLGSMLPDFATMLGSRPPQVTLPVVHDGIAFHHRTDDAFHGARSFLEFSRQASSFLSERGLARGCSRAVAHVGVELLLDGALAAEESANEAYLSALDAGCTDHVASHIHWLANDVDARFRHLCLTLRERGAFAGHTPAEVIAQRLRNILASRPRLAMDDAGQSVVREWVVSARPMIEAGAPLLLREVEQRLESTARLER